MVIIEAGNIAKTADGRAASGILIAATREEIMSLPFNPYGAEVKLVKVEKTEKKAEPKKTEPKKGERK